MAQDPFQVDQLQIEPGAAGTRLIRRATDGSLEFLDAIITGAITLRQLAGIAVGNLLLVGRSGAGARYTTIQAALDVIPSSASWQNPYVVIIGPGLYTETLNIVRDGVALLGWGNPVIRAVETVPNGPAAYHTIVIQTALGTTPTSVILQGLTIQNIHDTFACVRVVGGAASNVGLRGVQVLDCDLEASAAGGNYTLWATTANRILVQGGSQMASGTLSLLRAEECSRVMLRSVNRVPGLQLTYDNTNDLPSDGATPLYLVETCDVGTVSTLLFPVSLGMIGAGSVLLNGCTVATATLSGDRPIVVQGSTLGNITLANSLALRLTGSTRGTITPGGTATLSETVQYGEVAFGAEATKAVVFAVPQPDTNYRVGLELGAHPANDEPPWTTARTAAGFTINFNSVQTMSVRWSVARGGVN